MSEKTLNTRIVMKHDIESNWEKAVAFIPKKGEIIVYDTDDNHDVPRVKIGDGATVVSSLPFLFSSGSAEGDFVERSGDTMQGVLVGAATQVDTAAFRNIYAGTEEVSEALQEGTIYIQYV